MKRAVFDYLKENIKGICLYLGFSGIFFVVFELYRIPTEAVSYAFLLAGFWLLLYGSVGCFRYICHYGELSEAKRRIESGPDFLPPPENMSEEFYQDIVKALYECKLELESKSRITRQEMTDYYGLWVHQIKTPIAALRVLVQSYEDAEDEDMRHLIKGMKLELFKIEQYVEMVLAYLRMETMSSDLAFDMYSLDDVVRQAVRKYSRMFILQRIRLRYETVDKKVLTDEKWLVFVIEQLLSNALKYSRAGEGCVSVYIEKDELVIEDNGIGIYPEDLPRVFEKGFTGYNGRSDKKSTGIGLYLCRSVMDKLRHEIRIESEPGKGTRVFLNFYRSKLRME